MVPLLWLLKSAKTELKIVLATLSILIILPAFAVVVFADAGLNLISSALAYVNPITRLVEIFDPDGNKVTELELSTTWPAVGYVTDTYGTHEQWRKDRGLGAHTGVDIANSLDTPITPFTSGTVLYSKDVDDSACGKHVKLDHGNNIVSLYCHMNSTAGLTTGVEVVPGDIIGYMGTTGTSTGVHLHFTVRVYGFNVDPYTFMTGEPLGEAPEPAIEQIESEGEIDV